MKWSMPFLVVAAILLLIADFLAFHDLFEPHTVRDWVMLAGSALLVVGVVSGSARLRGTSRRG